MHTQHTYHVRRYNFQQRPLSRGTLVVSVTGSNITITYKDQRINLSASCSHYPLRALEELRIRLERDHSSLLGINGCRKDLEYRMLGDYKSHFYGTSASSRGVDVFSPTDEIERLCTVDEHREAYEKWLKERRQR